MSLPLKIVPAVSRGVRLVTAVTAVIAPVAVYADHGAGRNAPVSVVRLGTDIMPGLPPRVVLGAASLDARVHPGLAHAVQENREQGLEVTCRVQDDPDARVFVLRGSAATQGSGRRWQLSMRDRETKNGWIHLALPGAAPVITGDSAKLSYKNANGGRQVDLEIGPAASSLDVWVDYGLDVNIEPDLDPRVDRLNTHGPIKTLACTIGAAGPE